MALCFSKLTAILGFSVKMTDYMHENNDQLSFQWFSCSHGLEIVFQLPVSMVLVHLLASCITMIRTAKSSRRIGERPELSKIFFLETYEQPWDTHSACGELLLLHLILICVALLCRLVEE